MKMAWQKTVLGLTVVVVVGLGWGTTALPQARAGLPPRPPTPTPEPPPSAVTASVELEATFADDWPWNDVGWQDVWTVVAWQDLEGAWHDVAGWQGTLDEVTVEDGVVAGRKTWWVDEGDLGTGPFRWAVRRPGEEDALAISDPFSLPTTPRGKTVVEVTLEPD